MKIATFNANSVRARMDIVIDWLRQHQPDALCIQETKVVDHDFPVLDFKALGYHAVFRGEKSYNGVAILSRRPLQNVAFGIDDGGPRDETRLVRGKLGPVHIVNAYVPQGQDTKLPVYKYKLEWFSRLLGFFGKHYTPRQKVLWCGDLNVAPTDIDVHDPKRLRGHVCFNPDVQAAFQRVIDWGFVDVFRKHLPQPGIYTFYDYRAPSALKQNKGWRIDHILCTKSLANKSVGVTVDLDARRKPRPSDHLPVLAEFSI